MKTCWKVSIAAATLALSAVTTTANAGPLQPHQLPFDSMMVQVRGGHGHGGHGWKGNRGLHRGWYIGRHRGWSHSRHRHSRW